MPVDLHDSLTSASEAITTNPIYTEFARYNGGISAERMTSAQHALAQLTIFTVLKRAGKILTNVDVMRESAIESLREYCPGDGNDCTFCETPIAKA